jgi:hypothetical protein
VREIRLHSGLENFNLVKGITRADGEGIVGFSVFDQAPLSLGMEALAQLAACTCAGGWTSPAMPFS